MTPITFPCPRCSRAVDLDVKIETDWWTVTCGECRHGFQLWRCPGGGHITTFRPHQRGDIEGLTCEGCGHEHDVLRVDDTVRVLRDAVSKLADYGPELNPLLRIVQGALRQCTDELNPDKATPDRQDVVPYPANRHARRIANAVAQAQSEGRLTKKRAARYMRGLR